jgi:hypothetical protein
MGHVLFSPSLQAPIALSNPTGALAVVGQQTPFNGQASIATLEGRIATASAPVQLALAMTAQPGTAAFSSAAGAAVSGIVTPRQPAAAAVSMPGAAGVVTTTGGTGAPGVMVGTNKKLVSTADGSTVFLIGVFAGGFQVGQLHAGATPLWNGFTTTTPQQWATFLQNQENAVPVAGRPYARVNALRVPLNTACWLGLTGIDPFNNSGAAGGEYRSTNTTDANNRTLYCAGTSGGGPGSGVGNEARGDFSTYRNAYNTLCANFLAAGAILGRPMYIMPVLQWTAPKWSVTGQALMPTEQSAALSPFDLEVIDSLAALHGNDPRFLIELINELYGTSFQVNANSLGVEPKWLGNANGTATPFAFPTATTSPNGTGGGYRMSFSSAVMGGNQTCITCSLQEALNRLRAGNAKNVAVVGCTFATSRLPSWDHCGGTMTVNDPYTVGGVQQMAFGFHSYNSAAASTANMDSLAAVGPFIGTEAGNYAQGAQSGSGVVPGSSYTRYKANYSGYITCGVPSNWNNNANVYFDDGHPFGSSWTMNSAAGSSIFKNTNTPVGNTGGDNSQIPTGSN